MAMVFATIAPILVMRSAPLGIIVSAYFDPASSGYWSSLDYAASRVSLIAIMNPNSGPGASQESAYVKALANLHTAGGKVIGYVYSSYATRPLTNVEGDISDPFSPGDQKLSHAAGDIRQPETRSENSHA